MKKALICVLLVICMLVCGVPVCAQETVNGGSFTMLNYNVAGLPDFNSLLGGEAAAMKPADKELLVGQTLEATGIDFIAVQEDFNYHNSLVKGLASYKYSTIHSGGVPFGDGLNIYSKTPVYNVEREEWRTRFGVYIEGDELTPKGILYSVIQIADGVYADVYDIHADAFDTEGSRAARKDNYAQVAEMIARHNADRPIIITGDFNITVHHRNWDYSGQALMDTFMTGLGMKDAWIEVNNGGNYTDFTKWTQSGVSYWGNWESVEKFLYKDGNGIHLEAVECDYVCYRDKDGNALSDHNAARVKFNYTLDDSFRPESEKDFTVERVHPVKELVRRVTYILKTLKICLSNLDELKAVIAGNKQG